jgi:hypothetical protein
MYKQHNPYAYALASSASGGLYELLQLVGDSHPLAKALKAAMEAIDKEFGFETVEIPVEAETV